MTSENFQLCHRYLYHSSADMIRDASTYCRIFALGDGYGKRSVAELRQAELMYDWSHVRDSSDEAIAAMADAIRKSDISLEAG